MQRLPGDGSGQARFYAELTITFDRDKTYWDSNGYVLQALTRTGHEDVMHLTPQAGKVRPRMAEPSSTRMYTTIPTDTTAIQLVVFAGPTKEAARRAKILRVPIKSVPVVREFTYPQVRL